MVTLTRPDGRLVEIDPAAIVNFEPQADHAIIALADGTRLIAQGEPDELLAALGLQDPRIVLFKETDSARDGEAAIQADEAAQDQEWRLDRGLPF